MRLTNKAREELRRTLQQLERAHDFIMQDNMAVARRGGPATTSLHYIRDDGEVLYEINKEVGSNLCGLSMGIDKLAAFIVSH